MFLFHNISAYKGIEFVFVPGDEVTLGWDNWFEEPDSTVRMDSEENLMKIGRSFKKPEDRLRRMMTPVRKAAIGPMLVERNTQPIGWTEVTAEELDAEKDAELLGRLEVFKRSVKSNREYYPSYRLDRDGEHIRIYLFNDSENFEDWADSTLNQEFDIPTEDEWEYMYGAGCRTLFPWGDGMDYSMNLKYFEGLKDDRETSTPTGAISHSYDLELPNVFGLRFLGDPYQKELTKTEDGESTGKGGEGGANHNGGLGVFFSYLPTAVYYRDKHEDEQEWVEWLDQLHYRRIVRL
ncbi:hypothetical protein [Paenibacillus sp. Leaf72]|uniref:hypothetical protein n=1 Tax=Paenibacillus sp. Leaf72 TaxID=1736234 RepID=UPI0012DC8C9E|nr:hypothetical protein [Paenibacillus sp. Leaf72]